MTRTLFRNGSLFTPDCRFVPGSLMVENGVITTVASGDAVTPAGTPPGTDVVDLGGRYLIPGFVDSHFHLMALALKRLRCDLTDASSAADVAERIAEWLPSAEPDRPVAGVDWDQSAWSEPVFPTRAILDAVSTDRPIFVRRICLHAGVANSAFLALLDRPGLERFVDRDAGLVTEDAAYAASRLCAPTTDAVIPAVQSAIEELHGLGITGLHDVVESHDIDAYLDGIRESRRQIRIDALLHVEVDEYGGLAERAADIDPAIFRPLGIKLFSDGSLGGRTAAVNSSYSDAQTIGEFLVDEATLERALRRCCDMGITCAVHAIGDRALRTVLMEMLKFPSETESFRIEHAELTGWDEIQLLKRSPAFVSMQPNFVRNWQQPGGMYDLRLGKDRSLQCNRFGSLREAGVRFMFGSDGMPPGPLYGIRGATHHPVESERIELPDAIRRYTAYPYRFGAHHRNAGELVEGNAADMVVLSGDPSSGDPDLLDVFETYFAGQRVYRCNSADDGVQA